MPMHDISLLICVLIASWCGGWLAIYGLRKRVRELATAVVDRDETIEKLVAVVGVGDYNNRALGDGASMLESDPRALHAANQSALSKMHAAHDALVRSRQDIATLKASIRRAASSTKYDVFMAGFPVWENLTLQQMNEFLALLPRTRQDDALRAYYVRQDHKREEQSA